MATTVPAAARTLAVFEIFAREKRELTKSEVARLLDLPESSCSDLLGTLEELGYLSRTVYSKRYYPTGRLTGIADAISQHDEVHALAIEATAMLGERTGESCYMGELDGQAVRIIATRDSVHPLRYVAQIGDRVAIHATAIGKALLAGLPVAERARVLRLAPLRALTDATKTRPEQVEEEILAHKAGGWYQAVGEGRYGLSSLAIAGWCGQRYLGLSITGPSDRIQPHHDRYIEHLLAVQEKVFGTIAAA